MTVKKTLTTASGKREEGNVSGKDAAQQEPGSVTTKDDQFDYMLRVEDHADNFFEIKHKISFFLITASIGSIGYTLNFAIGKLSEITSRGERSVCLIVASVMALATTGLALLSMYYDMQSYRLNLRAYFGRKQYDQMSELDKGKWRKMNRNATYCQRLALTFLFLSILYQATLFVLLIF